MEKPHNNPEQAIKTGDRYAITGYELRTILSRYGLNHEEYGAAIGKSAVTIRRWISEDAMIKLRYAQILEEEIGKEIYCTIIMEIWEAKRKREEEDRRYTEERERKIEEQRMIAEQKKMAEQKRIAEQKK